jgi:hypothetical protein
MIVGMTFTVERKARAALQLSFLVLAALMNPLAADAQLNYSVRFELEKPAYLLGEPIFCQFMIRNTGMAAFNFRYRAPTRILVVDETQEPQFTVTNLAGRRLSDPGPRPCGNPQGTAVYGSVTLPPGKAHTEHWLLNQWAQFSAPGSYNVRAQRRLALLPIDPQTGNPQDKPAAFALVIDDLNVEVERSTPAQMEAAFQPYLDAIRNPQDSDPAEAVTVVTSMPQPFFLDQLIMMLNPGNPDRWDRRDVVNGLARLDTPASWRAILKFFRSGSPPPDSGIKVETEDALRSYALQVLAEKGDSAFLPAILATLAKSPEPLRGDILRALGFFHDPKAFQPLYDNLHSPRMTDRMDAILGLKNLGTKDVIPALMAALSDPDPPVEQVANFALQGLTDHKEAVSPNPSPTEFRRIAGDWHAWWHANAATFSLPKPAACHDW